jgi:hypothetical protein
MCLKPIIQIGNQIGYLPANFAKRRPSTLNAKRCQSLFG